MISKYHVHYYVSSTHDNPVKKFLDTLSEKQQAKVLRLFQCIKEYGLSSIIPHIKKLADTPLWEIRILGKDNIRILYAVIQSNAVLILHGFMKKSPKTPEKEIHIATLRYQEWKNRIDI